MRRIIHILLLCLAAAFPVAAAALPPVGDWAKFSKYADDNARVAQLPDSCRRVVFMGNSITYFWNERHPQFFADNGFICRGISGQTTYQFLLRFRNDVVGLHPQTVVLMGGINDIAENTHVYDEERTLGNLVSMAEIARANGIEVILCSVLPANHIYWLDTIRDVSEKVIHLNERIRSYAEANGIPYVDYYSVLVGDDGAMKDGYAADTLHPTPEAYTIMEQTILPYLHCNPAISKH